MRQSIGFVIYDTEKSTLLASGSESGIIGSYDELYRAPSGRYFLSSAVSGYELMTLSTLTLSQAIDRFNRLPCREVDFEEAFPDVAFEEA